MISFIVPAHNEQACLGRTLLAIHDAARATDQPYEIIVVNDASTDATAEIARQNGAIMVPVNHRQIAATRNSGARAAHGERFFFVDADTTVNPRAVASALRCLDQGAAGGGAPTVFEGQIPLYLRIFGFLPVILAKVIGFTGGAFMFCTREAFQATGGFNERMYFAEEAVFAIALKREGPFAVLWKPVLTSGRRFRTVSPFQIIRVVIRMAVFPVKTFTSRESAKNIWYDSNRAGDERSAGTFSEKITNGVILLMLIALVTGPVWMFVPWSATPWGTPLGILRVVVGTFNSHLGLIFWPCLILTIASLLRHFVVGSMRRQKRWKEWIVLTLLIAFCGWQAWGATQGVIWFWSWIFELLMHIHAT